MPRKTGSNLLTTHHSDQILIGILRLTFLFASRKDLGDSFNVLGKLIQ